MKNNIIDFENAKIRFALKKFESTGYLSDALIVENNVALKVKQIGQQSTITRVETMLQHSRINAYIDMQSEFNTDYATLLADFKTHSPNFMFPGILNHYRKGINPVAALYLSLQEALFKYHDNKTKYKWLVGLFTDDAWLESITKSLQDDVNSIDTFCKKYNSCNSPFIESKLKNLQLMQENFMHYAEVFLLVKEWTKENS